MNNHFSAASTVDVVLVGCNQKSVVGIFCKISAEHPAPCSNDIMENGGMKSNGIRALIVLLTLSLSSSIKLQASKKDVKFWNTDRILLDEPKGLWPDDARNVPYVHDWSYWYRTRGMQTSTDDIIVAFVAAYPEVTSLSVNGVLSPDLSTLAWSERKAEETLISSYIDLGCGVGSTLLLVANILKPKSFSLGVEAQEQSARLLQRTISELPMGVPPISVIHRDLRELLKEGNIAMGEVDESNEISEIERAERGTGINRDLLKERNNDTVDRGSLLDGADKVNEIAGVEKYLMSKRIERVNEAGECKEVNEIAEGDGRPGAVNGRTLGIVGEVSSRTASGSDDEWGDLSGSCDLITANPPYAPLQSGTLCKDAQRRSARFELRGGVEEYCLAASGLLAPGGRFVLAFWSRDHDRVAQAVGTAGLRIRRRFDVLMGETGRTTPHLSVYVIQSMGTACCPSDPRSLLESDPRSEENEVLKLDITRDLLTGGLSADYELIRRLLRCASRPLKQKKVPNSV